MSRAVSCLVTGAAGFVGSHLVEALVGQGYEVRCLVRKTSNLTWLKGLPVEFVCGDVVNAHSLPAALAGVDYVYHVAGVTKALREADYFLVNAGGTANLLKACAATGQAYRRIVLVSSLSALGPPQDGCVLAEDTPPQPVTAYGLSKLRAEVVAAAYATQLPITVVRAPAIYGPRDRDTLAVFQWAARGLRPITRRRSLFSLIHVRDLARGLVLSAEHEASVGRTYHLANDEPESLDNVTALIADALGRRSIALPLPQMAFGVAATLSELSGKLSRRPQIYTRDKALEMAQPSWVCDTRRAREELGFRPAIEVRDGIRETAEWYRRVGWLR